MKKYLFLIGLLILLIGCDTKSEESQYSVLKGATIYIGNGASIASGVIVIKEGVINAIGDKNTTIPEGAIIVDVTGKFITPGMVDAHIHFSQTGFFDGRPDVVDIRDSVNYGEMQAYLKGSPASYYEAYLRSGVTAVYDVGGFPWTIERQVSAESNLNAPHVAASGPLLTGVAEEDIAIFNLGDEKQMLHLSSPQFARDAVKKHSSLGSTGIKIWTVQLDDTTFMNSFKAAADEAIKQGNKLIVDCMALNEAKEALRLGTKVLVHSVADTIVDDEFIQLAKANDVIYSPTLTVIRGYLNTFRSLQKVRVMNDPNDVIDKRAKEFIRTSTKYFSFFPPEVDLEKRMIGFEKMVIGKEEIMATNLKKVYEAGITITVATDAGNPGTFHGISIYDEMEAMQEAGIPASDIIIMATKNGAMAMERLDDFGTLEKGKMADLIILDSDPSTDISNMRSITHVMRGGLLRPVKEPFKKVAYKK